VISGLFTVLLILIASTINPPPGPVTYNGSPSPAVFTQPVHPRAGTSIKIGIFAMPRGASHVEVVSDTGDFAAHPSGTRAFAAPSVPTPRLAGPWQINIEFTLHGVRYTTIGSVLMVKQLH
jgi:hypothetical protein